MALLGHQQFASPTEAFAHISEQAWSDFTKADYTPEQWHAACLIHIHEGEPTSKSQCKLPVKTPDGALNRHGVHAAAAALAGARGGLKGVSVDQKKKAANALKRYYSQLDEDPPESLAQGQIDYRVKPGPPEEVLEHHGVKGMRWGVRKEEETSARETARTNEETKSRMGGKLEPGMPDFQQRVGRITRTDRPQVLRPQQDRSQRDESGRVGAQQPTQEKSGLSREQKIALAFGAAGVAAAGYYAYSKYQGNKMPGLSDLEKLKQETQQLEGMKLPAKWDVRGLKTGPISTQRLGDLAGGEFNAKLLDAENLVINTSKGYADILPKGGLSEAGAARHASVTRVLEEMREKYPAIRNMNIEVVPMSKVPGVGQEAEMSVLAMRAGEARIMFNDVTDLPTDAIIRANSRFLPGLGKKDYVAYHEMGHLLAAAHGELPPAFDLLKDNASPSAWKMWQTADPLLHKKMFVKHGFTFKELSKLSSYAATEPAEAMAELSGHYFHPEMKKRLSPDQLRRAKAMFDEMGGLV